MRLLLTVGRYFKAKYGCKVRKIPISLNGFTCPNIDGSVAKGGCIYCKNESFSPSLALNKKDFNNFKINSRMSENPLLDLQLKDLRDQFAHHSAFYKNEFNISKYMVYFQSFTNTYAPLSTLKVLYDKALSYKNVIGLSIGTRVDCVDDKVLDLLEGYVKEGKEIWLEYGIQSVYEDSLKLTNRGHGMEGVKELFAKTASRGIKVCAHLIYGLPNETSEMMLTSLKTILSYEVHSIKIHPLYVVKGTKLANMYKNGEYEPITLEAYADLIVDSMKLVPEDIMVQRLSAGVHDESLIAPLWCFDKNVQMKYIRSRLRSEGIDY
ncbi:TIGR01212 family radical SAM protein [Helicobacter sp. 13S00401-1]|uniref:TIGR01212 family radical SAM protein n=1 Tax=Helicobacter sp. 13S00401-1 TaxID=1905758 RepID=UPI000BA5CE78|nr:TIGR01212 family radical SAM protein [Helicobacter sp. 13S00401-1]PAF51395.1 TIGR01212 family radical SAM protein [Helicobacter sp. 13S00401-1]